MSGNLADRFEQVVDEHGERAAVDTGTSILTYVELEARANRFAAWLRSVGVQAGDRVGLALWNRVEHLEALLGAFKARAVPVNVNFHYTAPELETLLEEAARSTDANVFVQENLTSHLTRAWAIGDAVAKANGKDPFTGGTNPSVYAGYPYDVYAQDGGVFATTLWNDLIDARRNRALAEEVARKALKPVSRKAMKNAARKAARR